jgi:hypothetical protein
MTVANGEVPSVTENGQGRSGNAQWARFFKNVKHFFFTFLPEKTF